MWWHHIESLEALNVLINYWWRRSPEYMDTPFNALLLAMLTVRDLPQSSMLAIGQKVLVPGRALAELQRVLGADAELSVRLGAREAVFEVGGTRLSTRLIEGEYPNYRNLLPSKTGGESVGWRAMRSAVAGGFTGASMPAAAQQRVDAGSDGELLAQDAFVQRVAGVVHDFEAARVMGRQFSQQNCGNGPRLFGSRQDHMMRVRK